MREYLKPHVHAAAVDDDLVLLDVAADAYFVLPGAAGPWRSGAGGDALLAALREKALTAMTPDVEPRALPPALPQSDLRAGRRLAPTWRDLLNLAGAWLDLGLNYRARSFSHILDSVRTAPSRGADVDPVELQRLARVFATAVAWIPAPGKCLARSFLLMRFLQRAGQDAQWVFGVRTWPFQAHCWVQAGDAALEDAPERLCAYTPILAV